MAHIGSHFDKYIHKISVQNGLIEEASSLALQQIMQLHKAPKCDYYHQILLVNQLDQESKITLYASKTKIIQIIQKKLLEHYHLNIIIKDIRIGKS